MFLEQGVKKGNEFWKYLLGSVVIIFAAVIGQIPLGIAVAIKSYTSKKVLLDTTEALNSLDSNWSLFLIMISFIAAFGGILLVVNNFHKQTLLEITTSRNKIDWSRVFFSFGLWAIFTIATTLLTYYTSPNDMVWNFKPIPFAVLFVIASLLIPVQTTVEEYVFRGYLMQGFANLARNKWFPLMMTSIIFGSMHILNPEVGKMGYSILIYYIGTGLFLGIITLMDDGMELAIGFHAANNLVTALLVTSDWTAFKTNSIFRDVSTPSAGFQIFIPVFVIFPLLLLVFSKKYNWNNWKEKLTGNIKTTTNLNAEYYD